MAHTGPISFERDTMMNSRNDMKEVFIKSFWEGVTNTFDEALEEPPPANAALKTTDGDDPRAPSGSDSIGTVKSN